MDKPRPRRSARPLSDILRKTIKDAFAKQGFAATELVTRWTEIVGPEIAAHCEPEKIHGRAPYEQRGSGSPARWCCGSKGRPPSRSSTCRGSSWNGSTASSAGRRWRICGCGRRRSAAARSRKPPVPDQAAAERIAHRSPRSATRSCGRRWPGWARRSGSRRVERPSKSARDHPKTPCRRGRHCHNDAVRIAVPGARSRACRMV